MVFPNLTELKLLTGNNSSEEGNSSLFIDQFIDQYPEVELVVTSIKKNEEEIGIQLYSKKCLFSYYHPLLRRNFGGSGDTFVALFIHYHFYKNLSTEESLTKAARQTCRLIEKSIQADSDELLILT